MTREQTEEMLAILAKEFHIRKPRLKWSGRKNSGMTLGHNTIRMGERYSPDGQQQEDVCLHEFAHVLTSHLYPRRFRTMQGYGRRGDHAEEFCYALWRVVTAWYGDPRRYAWAKEYKRVAAFGKRRLEALLTQREVVVTQVENGLLLKEAN